MKSSSACPGPGVKPQDASYCRRLAPWETDRGYPVDCDHPRAGQCGVKPRPALCGLHTVVINRPHPTGHSPRGALPACAGFPCPPLLKAPFPDAEFGASPLPGQPCAAGPSPTPERAGVFSVPKHSGSKLDRPSPRARCLPRGISVIQLPLNLFPAYAGLTRGRRWRRTSAPTPPRVRGANPKSPWPVLSI